MSLRIVKHRDERVLLGFGFKHALNQNERITAVVGVTIYKALEDSEDFADYTDDFLTPDPTIIAEDGKAVHLWVGAAEDNTQLAGTYRPKVVVETSNGQRLICMDSNDELPYLIVSNSPW